MTTVHCPELLRRKLVSVWARKQKRGNVSRNSSTLSFRTLQEMCESLDSEKLSQNCLADTLYRYLILLYTATGQRNPLTEEISKKRNGRQEISGNVYNQIYEKHSENEIWRIIRETCWEGRGREAEMCRGQYQKDSSLWNLSIGNHPIIER